MLIRMRRWLLGIHLLFPCLTGLKVLNANWRAGKRFGIRLSAKTQSDVVRTWRIE